MHIIYVFNNEERAKRKVEEIEAIFKKISEAVYYVNEQSHEAVTAKELVEKFPFVAELHEIYEDSGLLISAEELANFDSCSWDFTKSVGKYVFVHASDIHFADGNVIENIGKMVSCNYCNYLEPSDFGTDSEDFFEYTLEAMYVFSNRDREIKEFEARLNSVKEELREANRQIKELKEHIYKASDSSYQWGQVCGMNNSIKKGES